jgi:hypothetical protein
VSESESERVKVWEDDSTTPHICSVSLSLFWLNKFIEYSNFQKALTTILQQESLLTLRTRLNCKIVRMHNNEQQETVIGKLAQSETTREPFSETK